MNKDKSKDKSKINKVQSDRIENINLGRKNSDPTWWQPALFMFIRLSGWIIFPILIAITFGKWLDFKYKSKPLFFLVTIGISFLISIFGLIRNISSEYKKIEKESLKNKKNDTKSRTNSTNPKQSK